MEINDKIGKSGEGAGDLCTFGRRMKNSNANDARNFGVPTTILRSGLVGCDRKRVSRRGGNAMRQIGSGIRRRRRVRGRVDVDGGGGYDNDDIPGAERCCRSGRCFDGRCCGGRIRVPAAMRRASGGQRNGTITGRRESGLGGIPRRRDTADKDRAEWGWKAGKREEDHGPGIVRRQGLGVQAQGIILALSRVESRDFSWRSSRGSIHRWSPTERRSGQWSVPLASPAKFRVGLTIPFSR